MRTAAARAARRHPEQVAYATAFVTLMVAGALLRTIVLNWIVGPGMAATIVVVVLRHLDRDDAGASSP